MTAAGRATFERFLVAVNARDIDELDEVLHPDFEDQYPQSGEVTRGAEDIKSIIRNYPGGYEDLGQKRVIGVEDAWVTTPLFTVLRIEGSGNTYTGLQRARYPDGSEWYVVVIGELKDGKVWRVQTLWAPTFDPPAWRAPWVEVRDRP